MGDNIRSKMIFNDLLKSLSTNETFSPECAYSSGDCPLYYDLLNYFRNWMKLNVNLHDNIRPN